MQNETITVVPFSDFRLFATEIISAEIKKAVGGIRIQNEEKLLTREELANKLDLCTATITTYKNEGMPHKMLKSRPYFYLSDVIKYMESKTRRKKKNKKG